MTPAVIQASGPPVILDRIHPDRRRHHPDAGGLKTFQPDIAISKRLHRRHRIGFSGRPPFLFRLGIAREAGVARDLVVEWCNVLIGNRPVVPPIVFALHPEIGRQQSRKIRVIVQRRTADSPAALGGVGHRVLAFEQDGRAGGLDAPSPDFGTDEIGELPVRTGFQQHHFLACLRQHRGIDRAGCAGANDNDICFFVFHLTTSSRVGYAACRECRALRSLPSSRRRHRQRRRGARRTPAPPAGRSSPRPCSAASG